MKFLVHPILLLIIKRIDIFKKLCIDINLYISVTDILSFSCVDLTHDSSSMIIYFVFSNICLETGYWNVIIFLKN